MADPAATNSNSIRNACSHNHPGKSAINIIQNIINQSKTITHLGHVLYGNIPSLKHQPRNSEKSLSI